MQEQTFIDIVDLALDDFKGRDPQIVGLVVIAVSKTADDEAGVQVGSTMPPRIVREILGKLIRTRRRMHRVGPTDQETEQWKQSDDWT